MLTQCPGCQTVFRVTGAILRAAHGQVRCGKCNQQFDAIAYLLDQDEAEIQEAHAEATEKSSAESSGLPGISHEDIVLEGNRIEISGIYDRLSMGDGKPHLAHGHIIEEFNIDNEQWENPFDDGEPPSHAEFDVVANDADVEVATDEPEVTDIEDIEDELSAVSLAEDLSSLDEEPNAGAANATHTAADMQPETDLDTGEHITLEAPVSIEDESEAPKSESIAAFSPNVFRPDSLRPGDSQKNVSNTWAAARTLPDLPSPDEVLLTSESDRSWRWWAASIAMVLLLFGQAINHWRESLARRPGIGPALIGLYRTFGQTLTPEWQLAAYRVKQWGIVSDPAQPGTLRVRASVTNEAGFAQPYPVLRLVLEDRFGAKVGQRDFTAKEYMSTPPAADRLLDAAASANVDLTLIDPGSDAVGFQLDSCLPQPKDLLCTHDQIQSP